MKIFTWIFSILMSIFFIVSKILQIVNTIITLFSLYLLFTGEFSACFFAFIIVALIEGLRQALLKPIILSILREMGMGTPEQVALKSKRDINDTNTILVELAEKGKIEAIPVGNGFAYKITGDIKGDNFSQTSKEIQLD